MGAGVWKAAEKNTFYRHIFFCFPFCTDDSNNSTDNGAPVHIGSKYIIHIYMLVWRCIYNTLIRNEGHYKLVFVKLWTYI